MNQEIIRQTPLWAENWPIAYAVIQAVVILLVVQTVLVLVVCSRSLPTCLRSCSKKTGHQNLPIN